MEKEKSLIKKKKRIKKETVLLSSIIIFIILIDQALKLWIHSAGEITVIAGVLNFKIMQNTDAAYGIGSNSTIMYVATNVVILGIIFKFMTTQNEFVDKKLKIFLSFILAGGISNVIDRVIRGSVTEFLDFKQVANLPIFNIADIFVLIGWVAIAAIFASFTVKEWRNKNNDKNRLQDKDKKE